MNKIVIAIDGHSSTGKSTVAKALARRLGYVYVDTGAMYRAVTLYCIRKNCIYKNGKPKMKQLLAALQDIRIELRATDEGAETILNGESVENEIRSIEVANKVSQISAVPEVREAMVKLQQEMGRNKGVVMDGRDIGTVVFPDAELKIFMTADPEVRALRRFRELEAKGQATSLDEVRKNIEERDFADSNRAIAPLKQAEGAIALDNSNLSPDEQLDILEKMAKKSIGLLDD
ncbi:MAG: (d)CMP kinase [Prevotellaceae bacterium]|nr:(d)CMP kinase [Prevotellaceae bacterium]